VRAHAGPKGLVLAEESWTVIEPTAGTLTSMSGMLRRPRMSSIRLPTRALSQPAGRKSRSRASRAKPPTSDSRKSVTSGGDESSLNMP